MELDNIMAELVEHHGVLGVLKCLERESARLAKCSDLSHGQQTLHRAMKHALGMLLQDAEKSERLVRDEFEDP